MKAFLINEDNVIVNVIAVESMDGWTEQGYVSIPGEDYIGVGCKYFPETGILLDNLGREIDTASIARDIESARVRDIRDNKLQSEVDSVVFSGNWITMSEGERQVIIDRRNHLLNITEQEGFPFNIDW